MIEQFLQSVRRWLRQQRAAQGRTKQTDNGPEQIFLVPRKAAIHHLYRSLYGTDHHTTGHHTADRHTIDRHTTGHHAVDTDTTVQQALASQATDSSNPLAGSLTLERLELEWLLCRAGLSSTEKKNNAHTAETSPNAKQLNAKQRQAKQPNQASSPAAATPVKPEAAAACSMTSPTEAVQALVDAAYICQRQQRYQDAARLYQQAHDYVLDLGHQYPTKELDAETSERLSEASPAALPLQDADIEIGLAKAIALSELANFYCTQARYHEAEPLLQKALPLLRQILGPQHLRTQSVYSDLMQSIATTIETDVKLMLLDKARRKMSLTATIQKS